MKNSEIKEIVLSSVPQNRYKRLLVDLKKIRHEVEYSGSSSTSPYWPCPTCYKLFPRAGRIGTCPCHVGYKPRYLVSKLTLFISILKEEIKNREEES